MVLAGSTSGISEMPHKLGSGSFFDHFRPMKLGSRDEISQVLKLHPVKVSEINHTNLWAWKQSYPRRWRIWEDHLLCGFDPADGGPITFLQPVGPDPAAVILDLSAKMPLKWHRVDKSIADKVAGASHLEVFRDPEEDDYVYPRSKIDKIEGQEFHRIRQKVNRWNKAASVVLPIGGPNTIRDCLRITDDWLTAKGEKIQPVHIKDAKVARRILRAWQHLSVSGIVVYIEKTPVAYVIGEEISEGIYTSHIEKCDLSYNGIAAFAFNAWVKQLPHNCLWINRMQAQGDKGLKAWKESWRPDPAHMVKKCVVMSA